jgi:hypothetical protein
MAKTTTNNPTNVIKATANEPVNVVNVEKKTEAVSSSETFMFSKENYQIMIGGLLLIAVGFFLMAGGKSTDPHVFNKEEIYSFRRITLAPILVVLGFIVEIFAIMWLPKNK